MLAAVIAHNMNTFAQNRMGCRQELHPNPCMLAVVSHAGQLYTQFQRGTLRILASDTLRKSLIRINSVLGCACSQLLEEGIFVDRMYVVD